MRAARGERAAILASERGAATLALGFARLFVSLTVSYRLRGTTAGSTSPR